MFEFGRHDVNGIRWEGLAEDDFRRVLPAAGWRLDHLGTTTCEASFSPAAAEAMQASLSSMKQSKEGSDRVERMMPTMAQSLAIVPLLDNHRVHLPFWSVAATRLD